MRTVLIPEQFKELYNPYWRNIVYYGGRGGAKSWSFADCLLDKMRHKKIRALCGREILKSIEDSVHPLLKDTIQRRGYKDFEIQKNKIINKNTGSHTVYSGLRIGYRAVKGTEGIDIAWMEEAQDLSMESLDFLLPTIRKDNCQNWFSFNRFYENDPVWERLCKNPSKKTFIMQVNLDDLHPKFQSKVLLELQAEDKKNDLSKYLHIWKGEPVGQQPNALISSMEVQAAMERQIDVSENDVIQVGADIAREGNDKIAFYKRQGNKITNYKILAKLKTYETEHNLKEFANSKSVNIKIDMGAMGSGIYDHLCLDGYNMTPINFGARLNLNNPELYYDCATEMWCEFANKIDKIQLPNDPELKKQLSSRLITYKKVNINVRGKIKECTVKKIESKEDYKKREKESPDKADGVIMCFYNPPQKAFSKFAFVG